MASTFTTNIQLEEPARGDQAGTWDTPVNSNMTLLDRLFGNTTIGLAAANVVLAAAQFQSGIITFNSTLTASVTITFPTSFTKPYAINNICTGSSAFVITLTTTAAGGQVIACPPGTFQCMNDGSNIKFLNFGKIGEYWDYAGSSNPLWNTTCTVPPWLQCNSTTFSSGTYPLLLAILGSTTTPDARGRARVALDQGAGRISSAIVADTVGAAGGDQNMQVHNHVINISDPQHTHVITQTAFFCAAGSDYQIGGNGGGATASNAFTGVTATSNNAGTGASQNVQPTYRGGITLIRAA